MTGVPRFCPSCLKSVPHGIRCECQIRATRERNARHDARRPSPRDRGYDADWRRESRTFLAEHPNCAMPGCGKPASVVDHIVSIRLAPHRRMDRRNWQPLCAPCHSSTKQRLERNI
ncbi:HNH endonuclease signature motif containing protein [Rhizobium sp. PP-F2F-G48]|uniref:HNH endonuclease signature motif containing protein n=1 Tax=Rhizobium sp. PP-F2F-G48 TaxID=2135651 RepID=UPI00104DBA1C|nr:HNH endonuclease signature motif containing protein [Rhizobium sp. PP-F2F-G48]